MGVAARTCGRPTQNHPLRSKIFAPEPFLSRDSDRRSILTKQLSFGTESGLSGASRVRAPLVNVRACDAFTCDLTSDKGNGMQRE
jgi:hypothetical protein